MDSTENDQIFPCPACENTFVTQRSLTIHMILHENDPKFSCSICNDEFYKEDHLQQHVAENHQNDDVHETRDTHSLFSCEICG